MMLETKKDVWLIARELAEAIEESPELIAYRTTEDAVLADEGAVELIRQYEESKRDVKLSKLRPPAEQMALMDLFMEIEDRFNNHEVIQRYWTARTRLDAFLDRINAVVTYPITGQDEPKVKGGACSTGGAGCGGGCGGGCG